jgi:hypothetical protein
MSNPNIFINTVGDILLLPHVLEAANNFVTKPSDETMLSDVKSNNIKPLFAGEEI